MRPGIATAHELPVLCLLPPVLCCTQVPKREAVQPTTEAVWEVAESAGSEVHQSGPDPALPF